MPNTSGYDAIVVGAGPNGFAAAITMARAGRSVLLLEANDTVGGGLRSAELTLPGFVHDICSTVQALLVASPFFQTVPLAEYGVELINSPFPLAHPLDDGTVAVLERSVEATAARLGRDGPAYERLMGPLVADSDKLIPQVLGPFPFPPQHPLAFARFAVPALFPLRTLVELRFRGEQARALFAGMAAHTMLPLESSPTAAYGLFLSLVAHVAGMPVVKGGSQNLANALAAYFKSLGGEIVTGRCVESIEELAPARAYLFDVTPRQLLRIAGRRLPAGYRRALERFRYGPGVFKLDLALDGPIPWRAEECGRATTVHLGGTTAEISAAERAVWRGELPARPFMIVVQPSQSDPSRAPAGKQTIWAYCHVPNGSTFDMTERMEAQIERAAPGFRDRILGTSVMQPAAMERHNANYVGGDINGGIQDLWQLYARPTLRRVPYSTPAKGIYICSSSTPPGGGVHGMCGYHAARAAIKEGF